MTSQFFIKKRKQLTEKIENNSLVILHSNYQTFKSADSLHEFKVNNNFYYLTGLKEDNIILVLANINNDEVFKRMGVTAWECSNCGHIHLAQNAPEMCPVCAHPKSYFFEKPSNY